MNKETVQIEEAGIKMPFGKNLLNQIRLFSSASSLFSSLLLLYGFTQGKIDNITLITTIFLFFGGLITGTISIEDLEKIIRNISFKNAIFIILWMVGFVWGTVIILILLYTSYMINFK